MSAWPPSWKARMRRSFSETTFRCCSPATTRSIAASKWRPWISWQSSRPAKIAGSVQMFARGAARQPGRLAGDGGEFDVRRKRFAARVDAEDLFAPGEVRRRDEHLAVEAAGAKQCRIGVLEPARRGA